MNEVAAHGPELLAAIGAYTAGSTQGWLLHQWKTYGGWLLIGIPMILLVLHGIGMERNAQEPPAPETAITSVVETPSPQTEAAPASEEPAPVG